MTERQWWSRHVRKALHAPAAGFIAIKAEDKFKTGTPDVDCMFRGLSMKLELKFVQKGAVGPDRVVELIRPSQRAWILEWALGGGQVFILAGSEELHRAYMYNATKLLNKQVSAVAQFTWLRKEADGVYPLDSLARNAHHWARVL